MNDEDDEEELIKTAYHESGHAVCATLEGGFVTVATLVPESTDEIQRFGEVTILWGFSSPVESRIASILAGPVAEMIYTGEPLHPGFVAEWIEDWAQAWDLAKQIHPGHPVRLRYLEQFVRKLHARMKQDDCWSAVAAVADLLLAHESVENEDLRAEVEQWIDRW